LEKALSDLKLDWKDSLQAKEKFKNIFSMFNAMSLPKK